MRWLMSVPGIGPIIASEMVAAIGDGSLFSQGRDFGAPGSDWCRNKSRREIAGSLAAYRGAAIAICELCSFRQLATQLGARLPRPRGSLGSVSFSKPLVLPNELSPNLGD